MKADFSSEGSDLRVYLDGLLRQEGELWIPMQGESMRPTFGRDGWIRIEPVNENRIIGQILVIWFGSDLCVHRCINRSGEHLQTKGDGASMSDPVVCRDQVLGQVAEAVWPGGRWPTPFSTLRDFGWLWRDRMGRWARQYGRYLRRYP